MAAVGIRRWWGRRPAAARTSSRVRQHGSSWAARASGSSASRNDGAYVVVVVADSGAFVVDRRFTRPEAPEQPSVLGERLIGVAIQPSLTRLRGRDDRVAGRVRVCRGMTVGRVVAAQRRAARLTSAQMHPSSVDLHALLALMLLRSFDRGD